MAWPEIRRAAAIGGASDPEAEADSLRGTLFGPSGGSSGRWGKESMEGPRREAPPLDERERLILKGIIEDYIASGAPVGSQHLASRCEVSSATIRSVMVELETQGLLEKAHTSSGRRPTDADTTYRHLPHGDGPRSRIASGFSAPSAGPASCRPASSKLRICSTSLRHAEVVATPRPPRPGCDRLTCCASAATVSWRFYS